MLIQTKNSDTSFRNGLKFSKAITNSINSNPALYILKNYGKVADSFHSSSNLPINQAKSANLEEKSYNASVSNFSNKTEEVTPVETASSKEDIADSIDISDNNEFEEEPIQVTLFKDIDSDETDSKETEIEDETGKTNEIIPLLPEGQGNTLDIENDGVEFEEENPETNEIVPLLAEEQENNPFEAKEESPAYTQSAASDTDKTDEYDLFLQATSAEILKATNKDDLSTKTIDKSDAIKTEKTQKPIKRRANKETRNIIKPRLKAYIRQNKKLSDSSVNNELYKAVCTLSPETAEAILDDEVLFYMVAERNIIGQARTKLGTDGEKPGDIDKRIEKIFILEENYTPDDIKLITNPNCSNQVKFLKRHNFYRWLLEYHSRKQDESLVKSSKLPFDEDSIVSIGFNNRKEKVTLFDKLKKLLPHRK